MDFKCNLIDSVHCWLQNKYEEFTHWYWNNKSHHVTCRICGTTIDSKECDSPSPEERGWRQFKGSRGYGWVCHRCDCHRNFRPYVELADLDDDILWEIHSATMNDKKVSEWESRRRQILEELKNKKSL